MTNQQHLITPPPELVLQWTSEWMRSEDSRNLIDGRDNFMAACAAQWGADQELEAIIQLADQSALPEKDRYFDGMTVASLRAARRPKPLSLKEQALAALERYEAEEWCEEMTFDSSIIRRALEQLDD
jgi:hypothetical protein